MCGHEHRGREFRGFGFGRGGFPAREQWLERLQAYRARLEENLRNVDDLIRRLDDNPEPQPEI